MSLPVTLDQLEVFSAVARTGGFADAARELARTQSAVSKAVAAMERLLDVKLFVRSAQGATLTPEGGALLVTAREVLRSAQEFHAEASRVVSATEGVIGVAVDAFCPPEPILRALTTTGEQFPRTAIVVRTEHLAVLPRLVLSGTCAIGLCGPQEVQHPDLESTYLATTWMVPVCASSHPLAEVMRSDGIVARSRLDEYVHLYLTERSDWLATQPPAAHDGVREPRWWKLSDLGTKHQCLRLGAGWGMMPRHLVQPELERGELLLLEVEGMRQRWPHEQFLVRRRDDGGGPVADFLCQALRQNLQETQDSGH